MREIKFRAWDKVNGCWASINSIVLCDDGSIAYLLPEEDDMPPYLEDEVELMQYTGLNDMNGVDIYEGDIVRFDTNVQILESEVTYYHGMFTIKKYGEKIPLFTGLKVIGNKFENPELLEEEK